MNDIYSGFFGKAGKPLNK